jgi:hypothetical protein
MKYLKKFEGFSNRSCDRCGKQTNTMSMSWLNTEECCMDCLEAEKEEPDYILAKQKEAEEVKRGNLNYGGWRNESNLILFESVNKMFVKDFLTDFGTLISLNFSQITKMGKDADATKELTLMMQQLRKPIINGQTYFEFLRDNINSVTNNPKLLSKILGIVRDYLIYIEPRVKKFVTDKISSNDINYKESWLKRIEKIKNDYKLIVSQ